MQRARLRQWIICGALVLMTSSVLVGKQGIVKTKDGRNFEGDVEETPRGVLVTVRGIKTTINPGDVDTIQYVGGIDQQYQDRLAKLPKNATAAAHMEIARWLFDNHSYDLAMREISAVVQIDPNNTDAATLEQTIQSQKRLERSRPPQATGTGTTGTTGLTSSGVTHPPESGHVATEHRYLAADDINTLRQVEWPKDDNTVRATIPTEVRKRYVAFAGESLGAFNGLTPSEQARKILQSDVKDLRKDVKILNDPIPLVEFRRAIQPMVLKGCGATGCHGGPAGGKFFLYNPADNDPATYTNFYLLTRGGMNVAGAEHMLIDRNYPENSLLAELGLPATISKVAHPEVNGLPIRPMFKGKDDAGYQALVTWMGKSLVMLPGPSGINFSMDTPLPPKVVTPPSTRPIKPLVPPAKLGT